MREDIRQEEQKNKPLSTAALAHVDDRNPAENRAENRAEERVPARIQEPIQQRVQESQIRRASNTAVNEADRATRADGGPTLVNQTPTDQNRVERTVSRQPAPPAKTPNEEQATPLFSEQESRDLFTKWDALQVGFIDEPRRAVEQADNLVATAMKRTAEIFAEERARLEHQWDRGDNVSTEDLRVAMRRYRSFFRRLLSV